MTQQISRQTSALAGFTLVELMVAVAVVAILAAIAMPSYQNQIQRSRRTEAKSTLLDLAGREEKLLSTSNAYSTVASDLGYSTFATVGSGYYSIAINAPAPAAGAAATFTITATPLGSQTQDTTCAKFIVTQAGTQTSQDNGGADTSATCWK